MTNRKTAERKSSVRDSFMNVRKSLQKTEWLALSERISDQLFSQNSFLKADTIHIYVSMEKQREVSTQKIIKKCFKLGKRVVVPKMENNGKLTHHLIHSLEDLTPNRWGVEEPAENNPLDIRELSLIIVPMVAADFSRNRIGYGKGYYDQFLSKSNANSVGLCFNCTLSWSELPTESFDEKPHQIITENKVL